MNRPPERSFVGVQALRGLAAMLVVLHHASQMVHERFGVGDVLTFGAAGVDLFFPISGFVMALTTYRYWGQAGRAADFLLRRLVRIVPLYWAATLLKIAGLLLVPAMASHPQLDAWLVAASFLFIPAWDVHHRAQPVVPIGWTLHFEMLFYVVFTLALWLRVKPVLWVGGFLVLLSLLPLQPMLGAVGTLANPILLEFVAGMFIGWATARHRLMPVSRAWPALLLGAIALPLSELLVPSAEAFAARYWLWGIPGALMLVAVIALEPMVRQRCRGWPNKLGDASYAIYLIHGFVLPPLGMLMTRLHWTAGAWPWLAIVLACALSAWLGWLTHRYVEKPVTDRLNAWVRRRQVAKSGLEPA